MNRLERFYKIDQLLQERTVVDRATFLDELEVSLATFKRDLEDMRWHTADRALDAASKEISMRTLDVYLLESYGIVRGGEAQAQRARLRFSVERSRWVASEVWHPDQRGSFDAEGRYLLELPFRDDRELVLDILRYGAEVEVLSPVALRRKVRAQHAEAAKLNG